MDEGNTLKVLLSEGFSDVEGVALVVLDRAVFAVKQEVGLGGKGFDPRVFLFEDFVGDESFVVVEALVLVGINVRIGHGLVLGGGLRLSVGHWSLLLDVHFFVIIFFQSLLLRLGEALWVVLLKFLLSSLSDLR